MCRQKTIIVIVLYTTLLYNFTIKLLKHFFYCFHIITNKLIKTPIIYFMITCNVIKYEMLIYNNSRYMKVFFMKN